MIEVIFYNFNKKENSTALPDNAAPHVSVGCILKENCSGESPVMILHSADPSGYIDYNYCYIDFFKRYFFVDHREYNTGSEILIYCREDYLGSARSAIFSMQSVFFEFCSDPTSDIIDRRIAGRTTAAYRVSNATLSNTTFTTNGCVVIASTGNKSSGLFILSNPIDIYDILDGIDWTTETVDGTTTEEILKNGFQRGIDVMEQFFTKDSASRNIRSALSYPWVVHGGAIGDAVSNYVIGSFPTGKTVYRVRNKIVTDAVIMDIPWNSAGWSRSGKYSTLLLYAPLFGLIKLPVESLIDDSTVRVSYAFSYENGDVSMQVEGMTSGHIVATSFTNASSSLAIGNSNISNTKIATAISSGAVALGSGIAASTITGGLTALAGIVGSGTSLADSLGGEGSLGGGGYGGFACAALDKVLHLYCITANLSDVPANIGAAYGYPNYRVGNIVNHSGFTKLQGASIAWGSASEKSQVNKLLNDGFYIE